MTINKFNMGQVTMTSRVNNEIADSEQFAKEVTTALQRYSACDWGDLGEEDKQANDNAVQGNNDRILAAYKTSKGKVYIITEWDRSYTTIMFASEY